MNTYIQISVLTFYFLFRRKGECIFINIDKSGLLKDRTWDTNWYTTGFGKTMHSIGLDLCRWIYYLKYEMKTNWKFSFCALCNVCNFNIAVPPEAQSPVYTLVCVWKMTFNSFDTNPVRYMDLTPCSFHSKMVNKMSCVNINHWHSLYYLNQIYQIYGIVHIFPFGFWNSFPLVHNWCD